jgi:plasmid replication initiation protein
MVEYGRCDYTIGRIMSKSRQMSFAAFAPEASTVIQGNQLTQASYTLTLTEKQLVLLAASQLDAHGTMNESGIVVVTAAKLSKVFDIPRNHAYKTLKAAGESLFERRIRTVRKSRRGRDIFRNARWISAAEYEEGEGSMTLTFAPDVIPFLTNLRKQFTTLELRYVGRLPTFYSVRLYELFMMARTTGTIEYTIDELRDLLNMEDNYQEFREFRRHVIEQSVKAINVHTDLRVTADYRSVGRKVTSIRFEIGAGSPESEASTSIE